MGARVCLEACLMVLLWPWSTANVDRDDICPGMRPATEWMPLLTSAPCSVRAVTNSTNSRCACAAGGPRVSTCDTTRGAPGAVIYADGGYGRVDCRR